MAIQLQPNMGSLDRLVRTLVGSAMFINGLQNFGRSPLRTIEATLGGAFLMNGISGIDPLLAAFNTTTIPGDEANIANRAKHAKPGPGIKPELTENVLPKVQLKPFQENVALSQALSVG